MVLCLVDIHGQVTVVLQHEETAGAEVAVELDEDLIGSGGHALLCRVAAELGNLRRSLVGPIPVTGLRDVCVCACVMRERERIYE